MANNNNIIDDLRLRSHINTVLLDYALTHLTTNYLTGTRDIVSAILSQNLVEISPYDANVPAFPTDPLDDLNNQVSVLTVKQPYSEPWSVDAEHVAFIRSATRPVRSKTVSVWDNEYDSGHSHRSMAPVLTRRAVRETPRLFTGGRKNLPSFNGALLLTMGMRPLPVPHIEDPKAVTLQDVLSSRLVISSDSHSAILSLLATLPIKDRATPHTPAYMDSSRVGDFFRAQSLSYRSKADLLMSPPLFARDRRADRGLLSGMPDVAALLGSKLEEDEDMVREHDLERMNYLVVNGWQTLKDTSSASSCTSSPASRLSSKIDQLAYQDTPPTSPIIQPIAALKMEEIILPRCVRGLRNEAAPEYFHASTLHAFLGPNLPVPLSMSSPEIEAQPADSPSLLGQPTTSITRGDLPSVDAGTVDLDAHVARIYEAVHHQDLDMWLIKEQLDGDDILLDVPLLPDPTSRGQTGLALPSSLLDFITTSRLTKTESSANLAKDRIPLTYPVLLRKVGGVQTLNIDLNWRPFVFGEHLLTHEEMAKVQAEKLHVEVQTFLDTSAPLLAEREYESWWRDDDPGLAIISSNIEDKLLLTTAESRRLTSRIPRPSHATYLPYDGSEDSVELGTIDAVLEQAMSGALSDTPSTGCDVGAEPQSSPQRGIKRRAVTSLPQGGSVPYTFFGIHEQHSSLDSILDGRPPKRPRFSEATALGFDPLSLGDAPKTVHLSTLSCSEKEKIETAGAACGLDIGDLDSQPSMNIAAPRTYPVAMVSPNFDTKPRLAETLNAFLHLRNRTASLQETLNDSAKILLRVGDHQQEVACLAPLPEIPGEVVDPYAIKLPVPWKRPSFTYNYLASVDLVKRRILVQSLHLALLDLTERDNLLGADLIVDPDTAITFRPLASLSMDLDNFATVLSGLSWRFHRILVIFEAYSSSTALHTDADIKTISAYAFSPPVLKTLKAFRRTVTILRDAGSINPTAKLETVFALTPMDAGNFARTLGDNIAQSAGPRWNSRDWLSDEPVDEEADLAKVPGMNHFCAALLLSSASLDDIISRTSAERMEMFGEMIGRCRVESLSDLIDRQREALTSPLGSSS